MSTAERRQAERGSIVLSPAVDYLTMTTRNTEQYTLVREWIVNRANGKKPKNAKSFMFAIENVDFASYGEGMHNNEPIYTVSINGADSDALMAYLVLNSTFNSDMWNYPRCDIQLTVPNVRTLRLIEIALLYEKGELGEFADLKATAKVRGWTSATGDSLYVGAPTSMLQIRIYDKLVVIDEQEHKYERFECQLRDDYANAIMARLFKNRSQYDRTVILQSLKYYHNRLPLLLQSHLSQAEHLSNAVAIRPEPVTTDTQERAKVRWALSLKRTLYDLAREDSHDGYRVRQMLVSVLVEAMDPDPYLAHDDWRLVNGDGYTLDPLTTLE